MSNAQFIIVIQDQERSRQVNINTMINYAYRQRNQYNSTRIRTMLCGIVFADLTAFFFLSFMNICFDSIVSDPPIWLLFILFMVMALDLFADLYLNRKITFYFLLHFIIMIFLILSWAIKNSVLLFLSSLVFLRFPQIVRFNEIMQEKLRPYDKLFKVYTGFKIFYMIVVVGHVLGCIFYAIDNTLIKAEYYGTIQQNPTMYYQGALLCYSPIYSLNEINRYIYAMYYIVSLLATVAYGDIIPKNPFQNAYVCLLLVLSTISISFIIEQLLIVLSDNWDTLYAILKKMKYFDSMLSKSMGVTSASRLKLVNFIFHSLKHEANNNPNIHRLTPSLQFRLMSQSIGMKKKMQRLGTNEDLKVIQQYSLPTFLVEFLLLKLELKYYPNKYLIVDNQNPNEQTTLYISLKGQLKIGYSPNFLLRRYLNAKNRLFCWRQFLFDNKLVHPHFRIQTKVLSQLYSIGADTLRTMMKDERSKRISDDNFDIMLEQYHVERQKQLSLMYEQNQLIDKSLDSISLVPTQQSSQQGEYSEVSPHIIRCWGCGKRSHFPINCPNLHYKVSIREVLTHSNRKMLRNHAYQRMNMKSKKIKPTKTEVTQSKKTKAFLRELLIKKNEQIKNLKNLMLGASPKIFESYQNYESYFHEFNFLAHNNESV